MIKIYLWIKAKLFKVKVDAVHVKSNFELYCEQNPWAKECRIYED
jgi:hypothetical protein